MTIYTNKNFAFILEETDQNNKELRMADEEKPKTPASAKEDQQQEEKEQV